MEILEPDVNLPLASQHLGFSSKGSFDDGHHQQVQIPTSFYGKC